MFEQLDSVDDPDPISQIAEVRAVSIECAVTLFDSDQSDFGALYLLADSLRRDLEE